MLNYNQVQKIFPCVEFEEGEQAVSIRDLLQEAEDVGNPAKLYLFNGGGIYGENREFIFDTLSASLSWEDVEYRLKYQIDRLLIIDGKKMIIYSLSS